MSRRSTAVALLGVASMVGAAASALWARERAYPEPPATERLLYVRSGAAADRLALSFDALVADVYWIRAIQHYGRDRQQARPDRFALLYPMLDLATTLDPSFNIAYRFGAIFLSLPPPDGPGRSDLAIALLRKGLARDPGRWHYALDIGFVHYWYTHDYAQAAAWFEQASQMPGAPEWIGPLAAVTRLQGGDRTGARQLLENLASASEPYIQEAARRGLAQLRALETIDQLQVLVDRARARSGNDPVGWQDIAELGGQVPIDDAGEPFVYDPATRTVSLSPESGLAPLPATLERR